MTQVLLCKKSGALDCRASGHADFAKKGGDIVCAAITVLLRTAMQTLCGAPELEVVLPKNAERGELAFAAKVKDFGGDTARIKIDFLAEYLKNGFESLSNEFPKNISFEYKLEE